MFITDASLDELAHSVLSRICWFDSMMETCAILDLSDEHILQKNSLKQFFCVRSAKTYDDRYQEIAYTQYTPRCIDHFPQSQKNSLNI